MQAQRTAPAHRAAYCSVSPQERSGITMTPCSSHRRQRSHVHRPMRSLVDHWGSCTRPRACAARHAARGGQRSCRAAPRRGSGPLSGLEPTHASRSLPAFCGTRCEGDASASTDFQGESVFSPRVGEVLIETGNQSSLGRCDVSCISGLCAVCTVRVDGPACQELHSR